MESKAAKKSKWIDCQSAEALEQSQHYIHPNGKDVGECAEGCCDRYSCPDCGTTWIQEVPQ